MFSEIWLKMSNNTWRRITQIATGAVPPIDDLLRAKQQSTIWRISGHRAPREIWRKNSQNLWERVFPPLIRKDTFWSNGFGLGSRSSHASLQNRYGYHMHYYGNLTTPLAGGHPRGIRGGYLTDFWSTSVSSPRQITVTFSGPTITSIWTGKVRINMGATTSNQNNISVGAWSKTFSGIQLTENMNNEVGSSTFIITDAALDHQIISRTTDSWNGGFSTFVLEIEILA